MPKRSTRNASGSGSIRQRKDGTWEARYTVGRDPGTGKQIQKSVYGKTKAEVALKLRKATAEIDEGIYTEPSRLTVGTWFDIWIAEYLGGVKDTTREQYRYLLRVHIKPCLGAVKLGALTAPMIQNMYNAAQAERLSAKSVRNLHGVVHHALDKAVKLGYIKVNPCLACELPRVVKKEMKTISGDHLSRFLQAIKGNPYEDLMFVTVFCGLRQGEVMGLTWDCIDFDRGNITISKQLQKERREGGGGEYRFVALKNDKQRTLTPAPEVFTVLRHTQVEQMKARLKAGQSWNNALNLVFTRPLGNHLSSRTVYNNFKRVAQEIGLPDVRFHDLRHTYATLSLQNGDDIKTVSENLGHATVAFTLDTYGHVTEKMKQDSANRMQALINASKA